MDVPRADEGRGGQGQGALGAVRGGDDLAQGTEWGVWLE